jgi:hypothetical protein
MPQITPEAVQTPESRSEHAREIKDALEANYTSAKLGKGEAISLRPDILPMASCRNQSDGMVSQELMMVIKAGGEVFSVVDVFVADKQKGTKKTTALTRHIEGGRAEIVGLIEGSQNPMIVGRTSENGYSDSTSRQHFAIGRSPEDGHFDVLDAKSSNGTELFVSVNENDGHSETQNPATDINFWSAKSSQLKAAVLQGIES